MIPPEFDATIQSVAPGVFELLRDVAFSSTSLRMLSSAAILLDSVAGFDSENRSEHLAAWQFWGFHLTRYVR